MVIFGGFENCLPLGVGAGEGSVQPAIGDALGVGEGVRWAAGFTGLPPVKNTTSRMTPSPTAPAIDSPIRNLRIRSACLRACRCASRLARIRRSYDRPEGIFYSPRRG